MKIGFVSLGCPKNLVDSEVMIGLAQQAGHTLTPDAAEADALIVNTCSFIESAREESVNAILEMAGHKGTGKCRRLIVTGCMAERYRDELRREIPEIDALLGTGEVPGIVDALRNGTGPALRPVPGPADGVRPLLLFRKDSIAMPAPDTDGRRGAFRPRGLEPPAGPRRQSPAEAGPRRTALLPAYLYDDLTPRTLATPGHFAYVKIAEGCNYKCSFCIIPQLRGAYRSRSADSVVREARSLADRGVKELLLVSQDTTHYGVDRGERGALARLLRELNRVDGIEWIRLLYLYPTTLGTDTLTAIAECDKVCKYVDLPLQHASDAVLRRMRRPGTRATYERLLDKVRRMVPGVAIRTTFIVGFPGETAAEFEELREFVAAVRFDHMGVFTYSHEEGTTAGRLADDVPGGVKAKRQRALMTLQKRLVAAANRARIGQRVRVLVDGPSPDHPLIVRGRLAGQAPDIDSAAYLSEVDPLACRPGDLIDAQIVSARGYDLVVRPLPGPKSA